MRFEIELTEVATADLSALPLPVRRFTIAQLDNLREDATLLSQPTRFPYPPNCQIFLFDYDHESEVWRMAVLFRYSQDERSIIVLGIGRTRGPIED